MRSRKGTSRRSARWITISRLGCARPVSRKLRWRVEMSASHVAAQALAVALFAEAQVIGLRRAQAAA
ncbi:hypothetical protein WMF39_22005 [Sorangium sp. So ce1504]